MSSPNIESQSGNNPIVQEVMETTRDLLVKCHNALYVDIPGHRRPDLDETPEAKALEDAIRQFAISNLDNYDHITNLPHPEAFASIEQAYLRAAVAHKLGWTAYVEYEKARTAQVRELLEGRTLRIVSIGSTLDVVTEGFMRTSDKNPLEATGLFSSIEPVTGHLNIGAGEPVEHRVNLWKKSYVGDGTPEQVGFFEIIG